jgi:hypothetical protein
VTSSLCAAFLFLEEILQKTAIMAPMRIAPPTPTTTPMMVFFWSSVIPELSPPLEPLLRPGVLVESEALVPVPVPVAVAWVLAAVMVRVVLTEVPPPV